MKRIISVIFATVLALCAAACDNKSNSGGSQTIPDDTAKIQRQINADLDALNDYEFSYSQLTGADALGRQIEAVSGLESGKYVGIFYCEWMGYSTQKIYDISKINAQYPDKATSPLWAVKGEYYNSAISPNADFHYWSEPLYGYYDSDDPWVIKKHLEILSALGVDYILLDNTNTITYDDTTKTILETVLAMQAAGRKAPRVSFLLPNSEGGSVSVVNKLYSLWFSDSKYNDCWFYADEEMNPTQKPLVIGRFNNAVNTGKISEDVSSALWLKEMQWPTTIEGQKDLNGIPWMDWSYPQTNHNGVMSVSVAQHIGGTWSSEASRYPEEGTVFSARGWTEDSPFDLNDTHGRKEENVLKGSNFELQWQNALKADVKMVVVTGFNEWIAQKLSNNYGNIPSPSYRAGVDHAVFVDLYDITFSRDVEMMKGGYGDNYLMQLAVNIRKFKGMTAGKIANVYAPEKTTVNVSDFSGWDNVSKNYLDFGYDCSARNYRSVDPDIIYTDNTNRNNLQSLKFANDDENLYVLVTAENDITEYNGTDDNWMNVYISGYACNKYDFVINRSPRGNTASIEKISDGKTTKEVGQALFAVEGNQICFAVPLSVLGYAKGLNIGVKATDNIQDFLNTDDFYISGDCAPIGRLNFVYKIV